MKDEKCAIVEELLPAYVEDLSGPQVNNFIEEHLKTCEACSETCRKMKMDIRIVPSAAEPDKKTLWYLNGIKAWYLICPLLAFVFSYFGWTMVFHIYEGLLGLLSAAFLASEFFHRSTWWDQECIGLQEETRKAAKKKWGSLYIRPLFWGIPPLLVIFIARLPEIIDYIL